jgi:hypothetical protein
MDAPPNSPVARARRGFDEEIPPERFPKPDNIDEMSDDEIGAWYNQRLPPEEREKYTQVCELLGELGLTKSEKHTRTVMNAFHVDPEDPVDVEALLEKLGVN